MRGGGKVSFIGLLLLSSSVVQGSSANGESDKAPMFRASLLAVANSSDILQKDTHTVMLSISGNKGYVKFYSVAKESVIRVDLRKNRDSGSWVSASVTAKPDLEKTSHQKLNATKVFADALSNLGAETWLTKDKFRVTVVSADNIEYVLYRVSVDPYYEWNSLYLKVSPDGTIKDRWSGY